MRSEPSAEKAEDIDCDTPSIRDGQQSETCSPVRRSVPHPYDSTD